MRSIILVLLLAAVAIAGVLVYPAIEAWIEADRGEMPLEPVVPKVTDAGLPVDLSIVCVGDIMVHKSQIASQYDSGTGTFNYDNNFQYVKEYVESADLAICNVETTFAGGTPTGYPSFNAPDALAESLADAGFDLGLTSNNHLYDKGLSGLKRTLRVMRSAGLATAGTKLPWERNYALMNVKGVKIAVISYTYETPSNGGRSTINGVVLPGDAKELINSFNYELLDEDLKKVEATMASARESEADIIICYYHWGEEYQREPNLWQEYIAEKTIEMGADIIFASHPHVLQRVEILEHDETGKKVPVFYSMGNFLSNQRSETLNNRYTEQGMIARVNLKYDRDKGEVSLQGADAMNTWLDKYKSGGKDVYAIVPLDDNFEDNEALKASGHLHRAVQASSDVEAVIGRNYIWK
ncbi:CapA family protein [Bacillota bacterium]